MLKLKSIINCITKEDFIFKKSNTPILSNSPEMIIEDKIPIHISILGSEKSGKSSIVKSQIYGAKLDGASYEELEGLKILIS